MDHAAAVLYRQTIEEFSHIPETPFPLPAPAVAAMQQQPAQSAQIPLPHP